jgi:hypothetical protein
MPQQRAPVRIRGEHLAHVVEEGTDGAVHGVHVLHQVGGEHLPVGERMAEEVLLVPEQVDGGMVLRETLRRGAELPANHAPEGVLDPLAGEQPLPGRRVLRDVGADALEVRRFRAPEAAGEEGAAGREVVVIAAAQGGLHT